MLTAKIYLAESGQVADLQKDFPIYQGQFQNILLNVFVPTSLLAANFTEKTEDYGDLTTPFVAGTAVKIAMRTVARNGAFKVSNDHYLRYVKTLIKDGVQYALYERKMPREFTFYAGQGINAPTLIVNVVNVKYGEITAATAVSSNTALTVSTNLDTIKTRLIPVAQKYVFTYNSDGAAWYIYGNEVGNTAELSRSYGVIVSGTPNDQDTITLTVEASEPAVTNITTTQTMRLDVMPSSDLDNDTAINADEWDLVEATITSLTASINALVDAMPLKQDISDARLETVDKTVVGAINEVNTGAKETDTEVDELQQRVSTLEQSISTGETYIGTITTTELPTDKQLNSFVEQHTDPSRSPKPGDTVIVVLQIPDATDKNYKYFFSGTTQSWSGYEIPPIELASNGTAGIVSGTYSMTAKGYNVLVDIVDGEIRDIYAKISTSENYVSVKNQLDILTAAKDNIISGVQTVGVAERAKADEAGNNILATYQTKASGATKQYVKDYALPKEFNDVKYLTADGYSATVPTTPETGIQFTAPSAAIGATELFSTAFTLADVEFSLGAKNGYSNNFYVSSSTAITAKLRLVTSIKKGKDEAVEVAAEVTDDIFFAANKPQKIAMGTVMSLLDDKVYELVQGDKIIQTLEIVRTDSTSATINVYCNTTYPSTFYLYTGSVVVLEAAIVVQEEGTSKSAVMSQDAVTMALAKKLGTPYGVDFPHGAGTVTYDTTDGMHIRGTMRIYTSADKTLFIDVPNTEVEIPIKASDDSINIDANTTGTQVLIKAPKSIQKVVLASDGGLDFTLFDGTHLYTSPLGGQGIDIGVGLPASARSGTLTEEQLTFLQAFKNNYIMLQNEKYTLADPEHISGFITYTHTGDESGTYWIKSITITINTRGWVMNKVGLVGKGLEFDSESKVQAKLGEGLSFGTNGEIVSISAYPIGAFYHSTSPTDPASLFGGTWEQITGKFLLASDDVLENGVITTAGTYHVGDTGGEATHTLTVAELPKHSHVTGGNNANYNFNKVYRLEGAISGATGTLAGVYSEDTYIENGTNYVQTSETGNGQAHNNMPPYVVGYLWKRIA